MQGLEVVRLQEQQGLVAQHVEVAFVKRIRKEIRLRLQLGADALDELPVLLVIVALGNDHQVIFYRKLLAEFQKVLVITLLRSNEVIAARGEFQLVGRVADAREKQQDLWVEKQPRPVVNQNRQRGQHPLRHAWFAI